VRRRCFHAVEATRRVRLETERQCNPVVLVCVYSIKNSTSNKFEAIQRISWCAAVCGRDWLPELVGGSFRLVVDKSQS